MTNSFPLRENDSLLSEYIMWNSDKDANKFNLFVEDINSQYLYKEIFFKKYDETFSLNIYPCQSKHMVIKIFDEWKNKVSNGNAIFIVDKDFSRWTSDNSPEHKNFFEWKYYTVENYFVNKEATLSLLNLYLQDIPFSIIVDIYNDWEEWLLKTFNRIKELFIFFIIAHKYRIGKGVSQSPYKFFDPKRNEFKEKIIQENITLIKEKCESHGIDWRKERVQILGFYNKFENKGIHEIVTGKYYLAYLFNDIFTRAKEYNSKLKSVDNKFALGHFISKTPLESFTELYNKIDNILIK